jgi:RHS repeat-associated protein
MKNSPSRLARSLIISAMLTSAWVVHAGWGTAYYLNSSSYTGTEGTTISGTVYRHQIDLGLGSGDWNIAASCNVTLWLDPTGQTYPIPCADISSPWSSCQVGVTIPAWAYSTGFSIPFVNDGTLEYDQTSALRIGSGYLDNTVIQSASLTELDNDNTNGVAIYSGGNYDNGCTLWQGGAGGHDSATIRFVRYYQTSQSRTVNYAIGGDAIAGVDYTPFIGAITIAGGSWYQDVTITANNSSQTTIKTLTVAMAPGAYQMWPGMTSITITIVPNYPEVGVVASSGMLEGGSPGILAFYRTPSSEWSPAKRIYYTVSASATAGSDYSANLGGSVVIPAGTNVAYVQITPLRDLMAEGVENIAVTISANDGYSVISTNASASIDLYDDTPAIGVYAADYNLVEGQQTSLVFYNTNAHAGTPQLSINYGIGGTGANGTDFSLLSGSVTLPAGTYSVAVPISTFTDTLVEGTETNSLWLQSLNGQYLIDPAGSNIVISIADDYPVVQVDAPDAHAAEAGLKSGMFTITRTGNTDRAITVRLNVTGTATSGTDYSALPASVVLGAGVLSTNLAVKPLANAGIEAAETVVLSLKPDPAYVLGLNTNAVVTITGEGTNPRDNNPKALRYVRGVGTNLQASSSVIPLDGLKGTRRTDLETNGWFGTYGTRYHYNATNAGNQAYITNRTAFNTPIASFGGSWGQSLYIGQSYALGIAQGNFTAAPLMIIAIWRTNHAQAGVMTLSLPQMGNSNDWTKFSTNGFARSTNGFGLTTVLRSAPDMDWGTGLTGWALTHTAADAATNYIYLVCAVGTYSGQSVVLDETSSPNYGYFYELSFEQRPAWRSLFVDQPHFQGEPLPPDLWSKSPEELLHYGAPVTSAISLPPAACQAIDQSPELRRHPILDQFVEDMNNNPLALANYVQNEIELTDPIAYRDDGSVSTVSVNEGGVNRGALGVYLEGQGSPVEQCALLVYLLRQAGYPACYVFPPEGGLKILDKRLSALLRMRLNGAQDVQGRLYTTNEFINVNYPWVAAYVTNQWVHLFPWAKDTAVEEGLNIYDYLPTAYKETQLWVRDYLLGKTNIMAFATPDDDTPGTIFPRFLNAALQTNAPGISLDDLGMRHVNRRHVYAQWSAFPRPTQVTNVNTAVESLASAGITNVSPALTNIFDTVQVELYSVSNPQQKIQTAPMRMADLHNRKFFLTHTTLGNGQIQAVLTLGAFRPNGTATGNFSASDTTLTNRQVLTMSLNSTDDNLKIRFRHRRQRALSWETALDPDRGFLDLTASREVLAERPLRVGDVGAICFNAGRVTPAMLRVHAQELWNMEQTLSTNSVATNQISMDVYQGSLVYLMGMSYYERTSRYDQENRRLFKIQNLSSFAMGLAKISPRRNTDGALYNGKIDPVWPNVDMFFQEVVTVGNGTLRPDSGWDNKAATRNYYNLSIADLSAQEHATINVFFGQSNAVSTAKLLQLAQSKVSSGGAPVVELNYHNYQSAGNTEYNGKALKDHDPSTWDQVVSMFQRPGLEGYVIGWMPPGPQTNASGSFAGMGAFVLGVDRFAALIGNNQYGAYGDRFNFGSIGSWNTPNFSLQLTADGDYTMDFSRTANLFSESWTTPSALQTASLFANGSLYTTPFQSLQGTAYGLVYNGLPGTYSSLLPGTFDLGLQSTRTDYRDGNSWWQNVADPVNALTGEFYIDEVDLSLPGPMPLQMRRNYGSQNLANNQLGYGWKLNYMPYLTVVPTSNIVYEAEADGSVLAFGPVGTDQWAPTLGLNPTLNNNSASGIGSVANRLNARLARVAGPTNTWYLTNSDGSLRIFQERSFPLTNSASYDRLRPYLTKWLDNRGNFYRFEYGTEPAQGDYGQVRRIVSSSGNIVRLLYDQYSRVVEAYSADGRRIRYEYDIHGDLRTVTLPDASEINYEYQVLNWSTNGVTNPYSTHLLTREEKPDGRVLRNEFDSQRRVTNQWATVGPDLRLVRNATFRYTNDFNLVNLTSTISGTTTILDYTNNPTTYFYTNGLIRRIRDPLGAEIVQEWYEANETNAPAYPRSLESVTDKRGLLTSYYYDSRGNATNVTVKGDLLGDGGTNTAVTITVFNSNNIPEKTILSSGTTNLFFYTNGWLLARLESWPSNAAPAQAITNLYGYLNVTNADGTSAFGLRSVEVRAAYSTDAATNETAFNSRGFPTRLVRYTGTADPAVIVTNLYNSRGELVMQTDTAGRSVKLGFTPRGNPESKEVFEAGQTIPLSWEYSYYNENGEPTWSDGPRFDPEDYVWRDYDGGGRKTQEIRWRTQGNIDGEGVEPAVGDDLFATTFNLFDPFGNLVRTIDPLGNYSVKKYDSIGQLIREEFYSASGALLATNGFRYNFAGDVTNAWNSLGGLTEKRYTSTGKLKFQKNPDGSTNRWLYLADGRLRREYQGNGAYWETTYDDANRKITKVFYSPGTPSLALATNSTVMDRRGNVVRSTDAGFNTWTNLFDGLDRLKISAGPVITTVNWNPVGSPEYTTNTLQQATTYIFDSCGKTNIVLNGLGEKVVTARDALGRTLSVQTYASNSSTPVRVTSSSYTTNHHGYTITEGTQGDAISTTTYTDTFGQPVLTIQSPWQGFIQYTWTKYDRAGNRLQSDVFSSDSYYAWTESAWTYDGLNRVQTERVGDGATFTYNRDGLGNVTNRLMPGNLQWFANYNSAGQMLKEWTIGTGNAGTRTNSYVYYPVGNTWAGQLQTSTDGRGVTCSNSYDAWLRAATNVFTGSSNEYNLTRVLVFDARGLNTGATEWFASSSVAPTSTVSRVYNAYSSLQSENITLGGASFSVAGQTWNVAGRRSGLTINSMNYGFGWRADGVLTAASSPAGSASYTWNNAGQLNTRSVGDRTSTYYRDGMGRPWEVDTDILGNYVLSEEFGWTDDGLLGAHTVYRPGFTDVREYSYGIYNRRLIAEKVGLSDSKRWTNNLVYDGDNNAIGGPGVLTRSGASAASAANWNGTADAFARVGSETNNVIRRAAYGRVNGPSTVKATLDGVSVGTTILGTNGGQWRASLDLTPGTHQLSVTASHTSGQFSTNASSWFTNTSATDRTLNAFDASGQLRQKVWLSSNGTTNRTQNLYWDAKGRLWKVVERDSGNSGYDWTSVYDAFDRRLQTATTMVTNGVAVTAQTKAIRSYFDPAVEFLEVGLSYNGQTTWKLHGPDLNGMYGGMQGVGGLEAVQTGYSQPVVLISDVRGNVLQQYDTWTKSLTYSSARPTGYGAAPGYEPVALGLGASFGEAASWRGRWKDITGYYWLGKRYYSPQSGSWLSYDSAWNVRDPNWLTFCGDDPINYFDPDGRCVKTGLQYGAKGFDAAWNFGLSMLFSPNPEGATEQQRQALSQIVIQSPVGSPMRNWFGAYDSTPTTSAFVEQLPGQLTGPGQDAMMAYGALRGGTYEPAPVRETQWGAPINDPYISWQNDTRANIIQPGPLMLPAPKQPLLLTEGSLESRVGTAYQDFYNAGWQQTVANFNQGRITVPAGLSWETVLGQRTDAAARDMLRDYLSAQGIPEGPGGSVLVNRRLYDPSGSGGYRIPDVRIPGANLILDGTIGTKTPATPQVQDFMNWGNNRVNIVPPTVLPGFKP